MGFVETETLNCIGKGYTEEVAWSYGDNCAKLYSRKSKCHFRERAGRFMLDKLCSLLKEGDAGTVFASRSQPRRLEVSKFRFL